MPLPTEERRLVTILFADLSGFTALARTLEPEDVREAVNVCFEHLNKVIVSRGGTIHKYEGDLVIALFGLPAIHEDDPERAVRAALEMLDLMPEINQALGKRLKIAADLGLHIGINSGTVVAGEVGSAEKREYTIMGDTVNLASRLKDVAQRSEAVVSEAIFRTSRYLFDYEARPPISIKGIGVPVRVFRPLGVKSKPEPKRGIQGLRSPMVGRVQELNRLQAVFEETRRGCLQSVFVIGDPGLGKSRLLAEFKQLLTEPVMILEGRCFASDESTAYGPFLQLLRAACAVGENDDSATLRTRLLESTRSILADESDEIVPYLGHLFSVKFGGVFDEKTMYLDAQALKMQVFSSVRRLLLGLARRQPLVIIIEDFHWIDPVSLELFEYLTDGPGTAPLCLISPARIERQKEFWKVKERTADKLGARCLEVIITPLDARESDQLAYNLLTVPEVPDEFKAQVLKKAEGNPFYLEEIIRSLIDNEVLQYSAGHWRANADAIRTLRIPDSAHALILSRFDRLEREVRDVLLKASVIGRSFRAAVLESLCDIDRLLLSLQLATLEEYEYIVESGRNGETEYCFKHPLLQEVAYSSLLKKQRRLLHGKAAQAIEFVYERNLAEWVDVLAYHYSNSDNVPKAVEWLSRAGQRARARYALDLTASFFERLVELVGDPAVRGGYASDLLVAYEGLGDVYFLKGEPSRALGFFGQLLAAADDPLIKGQARLKMAEVLTKQCEFDQALAALDLADAALEGSGESFVLKRAWARMLRSEIHLLRGDLPRAGAESHLGYDMVERMAGNSDEALRTKVRAMNKVAMIHFYQNEYELAGQVYAKLLPLAETLGDKFLLGMANFNLGCVSYELGDLEQAKQRFQNHLDISRAIGFRPGMITANNNLANAYEYDGDYERALTIVQDNLRLTEEVGDRIGEMASRAMMISVYTNLGEYRKAKLHLDRLVVLAEKTDYVRGRSRMNFHLGHYHYYQGQFTSALECYRRAAQVARQANMRSSMIRAMNDSVMVLLELDRLDEAEAGLVETLGLAEQYNDRYELAWCNYHAAVLCLRRKQAGWAERALGYAEKGDILDLESKSREGRIYFNGLKARIYTETGDYGRAEEFFRSAIDHARALKRRRDWADAVFEYAKMLWAAGRKDDARTQRDQARKLYAEMELAHKLKQTEQMG